MATKVSVKEVEKLNRKKLATSPKTESPFVEKVLDPKVGSAKGKALAPKAKAEKKAKADAKNPATIAHRRLLIAVSALVKYGSPEQMEAAARNLLDVAVKVAEPKESGFRAYFEEAPSRLLPSAYKEWTQNGKAQKGALG